MEQRRRRNSIAGAPVDVDWTVLAAAGVVLSGLGLALPRHVPGLPDVAYWATAAASSAVFTGCLLFHGLAQAFAARRRELTVEELRLWPFGAVVRVEGRSVGAPTELRISAAGFLALGALAAGFWSVAVGFERIGGAELAVGAARWLARASAVLALVHVLPVVPLHGGTFVRAVLWRRYQDWQAAARGASTAGRLTAWIIIGTGMVAFLAGARTEGLWVLLAGCVLLLVRRLDEGQPSAVQR